MPAPYAWSSQAQCPVQRQLQAWRLDELLLSGGASWNGGAECRLYAFLQRKRVFPPSGASRAPTSAACAVRRGTSRIPGAVQCSQRCGRHRSHAGGGPSDLAVAHAQCVSMGAGRRSLLVLGLVHALAG